VTLEPHLNRSPITLHGSIDVFMAPRLLIGWVRNSAEIGNGSDVVISVYRDNRLIGEGRPTRSRRDLVKDVNYLVGFGVDCIEDIPQEAIAFDLLRIEARDGDGRTCRIGIWDRLRAAALDDLFENSTSLGKFASSAVLKNLGKNTNLTKEAREALTQVYDLHFEGNNQRLMYKFESLGKNCSFGSVQRAYGAEPLGLFRFTGISIEAVIKALKDRFRGVGSAEYTRLEIGNNREYYSKDTRYFMWSHTFVFEGDVAFDKFYQQQCKKITFLVRNMIEKLEDGEKIFVVHAIPDSIPDATLRDLTSAIRTYGSSPLLYLELASETKPSGTLLMREDGIMVGYVPQILLEMNPPSEIREVWLDVCRKADAMAQRGGGIDGIVQMSNLISEVR
jgi:hypothetical protein